MMTDQNVELPMIHPAYTKAEKITALEREIRMRKEVFRRRVNAGQMTPQEAKYQIAIFESILVDYRR